MAAGLRRCARLKSTAIRTCSGFVPEQAVRAACAADAVSGAALRGFAVPGDFAGMPKGTALRAWVELARCGVPVMVV